MLNFDSFIFGWKKFIFDSFGLKLKSQNYSTRPDSTVNDSVGSWLEQFPTRPIPTSGPRHLTTDLKQAQIKKILLKGTKREFERY